MELNHHRKWKVKVGVAPLGGRNGERKAEALARAIEAKLEGFTAPTYRKNAVEIVPWDVVKSQPGHESKVGLLLEVLP
jgi:hypothetical protein